MSKKTKNKNREQEQETQQVIKEGFWDVSIPKGPGKELRVPTEIEAVDEEAAKAMYFAKYGIRSTIHPVVIVPATVT
jgi:hypothetical protein